MDPNSGASTAECAPSADSELTLGEKMLRLDDVILIDKNEDDTPPTDDEESLVYFLTST